MPASKYVFFFFWQGELSLQNMVVSTQPNFVILKFSSHGADSQPCPGSRVETQNAELGLLKWKVHFPKPPAQPNMAFSFKLLGNFLMGIAKGITNGYKYVALLNLEVSQIYSSEIRAASKCPGAHPDIWTWYKHDLHQST